MKIAILVVDDEPGQRQFIGGALSREYEVTTAANGVEASQILTHQSFSIVITDERMPDMGGVELIRWMREHSPETPVIVLTAYGSVETAVKAIKLGAEEYLIKPLKSPEELRMVVAKVLSRRNMRDQNLLHRQEVDAAFPPDIIAESESMKNALLLADQVAAQPSTVLLTGESGTGKEVVARFIHRRSQRRDSAFVAINCAAIPETLLESEMFGHEKGAFTGAAQTRRGRFELADGGSLFLDEVADMGMNLQVKLLRVLQEQQFERIGSNRSIKVDVRIIAATNKVLPRAIKENSFREDLYYRLSVFPIALPPLRERREDIIPLAKHFLQRLSLRMGKPVPPLAPEAEEVLCRHDWPGNVRELANAIERALIVTQSGTIARENLPMKLESELPLSSGAGLLAQVEQKTILDAISRHKGDRRAASEELGISLRTLQYRLKDYGIAGKEQ
jgi:DNA-binding NtrC family response regulator